MDLEKLKKFDNQEMYKVYNKWPEIAEESYNTQFTQLNYSGIKHIVFAGMGGSGALGDIFSAILSKTNIHVTIVKGYLLPETVNKQTLVIITSVSGNTVEALTILNSAKEKKCKIIAFSSGGKLEEYCKNDKIEFRKIEQIHSPRASFPKFLFSMLKILQPIIPINNHEIQESIKNLKIQRDEILINSKNNKAIQLSKWIKGIPLIYFPHGLEAAAIRFKNSLQENVKMHVITEDVIEACHNGIVAWEKSSNVQPILLMGEDDYIKTKERWTIIKEFFKKNSIEYVEVKSVKGGILSKLINLIYFLDYTSIYLAAISEIDPSPVKSIDFIKSKL